MSSSCFGIIAWRLDSCQPVVMNKNKFFLSYLILKNWTFAFGCFLLLSRSLFPNPGSWEQKFEKHWYTCSWNETHNNLTAVVWSCVSNSVIIKQHNRCFMICYLVSNVAAGTTKSSMAVGPLSHITTRVFLWQNFQSIVQLLMPVLLRQKFWQPFWPICFGTEYLSLKCYHLFTF